MSIVLRFIYNNGDFNKIAKDINNMNCMELVALGKILGIETLNENVSDYIIKNILNQDNCLKVYLDSSKVKYNLIFYLVRRKESRRKSFEFAY